MHSSSRLSAVTAAILISIVACTVTAEASAESDVELERGALAHLIHELDAFEPLIDQAEAQASLDARIRFRYDWLRQDLDKIRRGIEEHLEAPRAEPRPIPPLRGDYRR